MKTQTITIFTKGDSLGLLPIESIAETATRFIWDEIQQYQSSRFMRDYHRGRVYGAFELVNTLGITLDEDTHDRILSMDMTDEEIEAAQEEFSQWAAQSILDDFASELTEDESAALERTYLNSGRFSE